MSSFSNVINGLDWSVPLEILGSVIPALICITLHELSHGYVAYLLGDPTAKRMGRLTLNPIKHIDIVGLIMMAVFKFGWAKPVPIDYRNFKHPKRDTAITAAAGPIANVIIACVFLFLYGLLFLPLMMSDNEAISQFLLNTLSATAYISAALAVFNLIPIPPLDGSKILFSFLSDETYMKLMRIEQYGMIILILLFATDIMGNPLQTATQFVIDKLFFFADWGFELGKALI